MRTEREFKAANGVSGFLRGKSAARILGVMNSRKLLIAICCGGSILCQAVAVPIVGDALAPTSPTIQSISVDGTNLVFLAMIPAGFDKVFLEMKPSLNEPWTEVSQLESESGDVSFTIPKPSYSQAFFRLNGTSHAGVFERQLISPELKYVIARSLASNSGGRGGAVFHFKGAVDGSDRILITRDGALWTHVNWGWPAGPVKINGTEWIPSEKNYLTTQGTDRFLPEAFSLDAISFEMIRGRDVIALERLDNGLLIYLDDTPGGADEYEFEIRFHPSAGRAERTQGTLATLKLAARIDGSDRIRITHKQAIWEHLNWGMPINVSMNGTAWDVAKTNLLANCGATAFLPPEVDLSSARIVNRKGRDVATMWADKESLVVTFADNPNGADDYELEISFDR